MDKEILKEVSDLYHKNLLKSPVALNYLVKERRINLNSIERFNIGYASKNLISSLYKKKLEKVIEEGIVKKNSLEDYFNDYITFPIIYNKEVTSIYGRCLGDNIPHLFLPNTSKSIMYNMDSLDSDKIIIVESPIDAISLEQIGFKSVAVCGSVLVSGTEKYFKNKGCYLWFDSDDAGISGTKITIGKLLPYAKNIYNLQYAKQFIEKIDANSYIIKAKTNMFENISFRMKNSPAISETPIPVKSHKIKKINIDESLYPIVEVGKRLFPTHKDSGNSIWVRCPNHNEGTEKNKSLWIGGKKNIFYCFGCHIGGGPIYLVSWNFKIPIKKAEEWILQNF